MTTTLCSHQQAVVKWADAVFPDRDARDIIIKCFEELGEIVRDPDDPAEYADVFILLLDLAHKHGIDGTKLSDAISDKMIINQRRTWTVDERTRIMRHD